jgi:hypothetical protein
VAALVAVEAAVAVAASMPPRDWTYAEATCLAKTVEVDGYYPGGRR